MQVFGFNSTQYIIVQLKKIQIIAAMLKQQEIAQIFNQQVPLRPRVKIIKIP